MANVFIGNGTKQVQSFMYWIPGVGGKKLVTKPIEPGKQIRLDGELDQEAIDRMVESNFKYGMRHMNEIHGPSVIGLIFNVGQQIPQARLQELMRHNHDVLLVRGKKIRSETAVLNSQIIENSDEQNGLSGDRAVKTEMLEEYNPNSEREAEPMSEGYNVDPKALFPNMPPPVNDVKRGRGRPRKAA